MRPAWLRTLRRLASLPSSGLGYVSSTALFDGRYQHELLWRMDSAGLLEYLPYTRKVRITERGRAAIGSGTQP